MQLFQTMSIYCYPIILTITHQLIIVKIFTIAFFTSCPLSSETLFFIEIINVIEHKI
jgi:hypothetical protein